MKSASSFKISTNWLTLLSITTSKMKTLLLAFAYLLLSANSLLAQTEGSLDSSFGINGRSTHKLHGQHVVARSNPLHSCMDANGRLVILSEYKDTNNVMRYGLSALLVNKNIDSSFGLNGTVYLKDTKFSRSNVANFLGCDSVNRILLVLGNVLFRFNPNGQLDASFGSQGQTTLLPNFIALYVKPNNTLTFMYWVSESNPSRMCIGLSQLNAQGMIDTSFNGGNLLIKRFKNDNTSSTPVSILLMPNQKWLIAGNSFNGISQDISFMQLNPDGSNDSNFGINGVRTYDFFLGKDEVYKVVPATNSKFLLSAGIAKVQESTYTTGFLLRFTANGLPDTSFGVNGKFENPFYYNSKVAEASSNRIFDFTPGGITCMFSNGQNHSNFGNAGTFQTYFATNYNYYFTWNQSYFYQNQFLFIGRKVKNGDTSMCLLRVDTLGNIIPFSSQQKFQLLQIGPSFKGAMGAGANLSISGTPIILPNKKILLPNNQLINGEYQVRVFRFEPNGTADNTFGSTQPLFVGQMYKGIALKSGAVYLAGHTTLDDNEWASVCKLKPDGSLDASFGVAGVIRYNYKRFNDIDLLSDGKILLTGAIVTRMDTLGITDTSFAKKGFFTSNAGANAVPLSDGSVLITADTSVYKLMPNGSYDLDFGKAGTHSDSLFGGCGPYYKYFYAGYYVPSLRNDGSFLISGANFHQSNLCMPDKMNLAKVLTPSGKLDSDFGTDGKFTGWQNLVNLGSSFINLNVYSAGYQMKKYDKYGLINVPFGNLQFPLNINFSGNTFRFTQLNIDSSYLLISFEKGDTLIFSKHYLPLDEYVSIENGPKRIGLMTDTFSLTAFGSKGIVRFKWDIPGANYLLGTNDTSLHPVFTFSTPGQKTVTLTGYTAANAPFSISKPNLLTAVSIYIYTSKSVASPIDLVQLNRLMTPQPSSFKWKFHRKVTFEPGYSELSVVPLFKTLDTGSYSFSLTAYYGANDSVVVSAENILRVYTSQISVTPSMGQIAVTSIKAKAQVSSPATFKWNAFQMATLRELSLFTNTNADSCRFVGMDTGWFAIELTCYFNNGDTLFKVFNNAFYIYADTLLQKPKVNFTSNKLTGKVDEAFFFNNLTEGVYTYQKWTINPFDVWLIDCNEFSRDLYLTFLQPGKYSVALVAANNFGKDSVYKSDYITIEGSVGLNHTRNSNEWQIYPNPSSGKITLVGLPLQELLTYQLIDLSGKILEQGSVQTNTYTTSFSLQNTYQSGLYILQIGNHTQHYRKHLMLKD